MATQNMTVATLAGHAAIDVVDVFQKWRASPDPVEIDDFCETLRQNGRALPVVYFTEWVDRWLMGDLVPGPKAVSGKRYLATCLFPEEAIAWSRQCGVQFQEQEWFGSRLREAGKGWGPITECHCVVVIREVIDSSTLDEQVVAAIGIIPDWLKRFVVSI